MKTLKLGICFLDREDNIIAKKVIEANWTINLETDVNKFFDVDIQKEIATILAEHLKLETTPDLIKEMLLECRSELEKKDEIDSELFEQSISDHMGEF